MSDVAEIIVLRWMCGVIKKDRIRNEQIRETAKVGEIPKKVQERKLSRAYQIIVHYTTLPCMHQAKKCVTSVRGFAKLTKFQKSEITLEMGRWIQVSLGKKRIGKSSQNSHTDTIRYDTIQYNQYWC